MYYTTLSYNYTMHYNTATSGWGNTDEVWPAGGGQVLLATLVTRRFTSTVVCCVCCKCDLENYKAQLDTLTHPSHIFD